MRAGWLDDDWQAMTWSLGSFSEWSLNEALKLRNISCCGTRQRLFVETCKLYKSRIYHKCLIVVNLGTVDNANDRRSQVVAASCCDVRFGITHVTSPRWAEVHFSLHRSSHINQSTLHRADWPSFVDLSLSTFSPVISRRSQDMAKKSFDCSQSKNPTAPILRACDLPSLPKQPRDHVSVHPKRQSRHATAPRWSGARL